MLISSSSSDFSVFLVSFYIPIEVPKFTTSLLLDLENIDQTTLSQPVDDLQDHRGLSVNLEYDRSGLRAMVDMDKIKWMIYGLVDWDWMT